MALINCPGCNKEVSDKAKKCVHCGYEFEQPKIRFCGECGNEIPEGATACVNCGCPIEEKEIVSNRIQTRKTGKGMVKVTISLAVLLIVGIVGFVLYNVKVIQPRKIEEQKKATYNEAISLLEKGKYEEGNELLETIEGYEDTDIILEQIVYESYAYSCVNSLKKYLKNPDSYSPYEIVFYETQGEEANKYPICIMHYGAQNGFGGNTTGYAYFTREDDATEYELLGSCDSLDEEDYDSDDEDELYDLIICIAINAVKESAEEIGNIDMARFKTVIKNDAYSTIKIVD